MTVAEKNSFTQAAKQLGISKAAVSQAIKGLEDNFEVPLFIRTTRKITLTPEGELLYNQCCYLKDELDNTRSLIGKFKTEPSGTLRISCNSYLAQYKLPSILDEYIGKFPKVKIELLIQEQMPDLQKEKIDIVFGVNCPASDDIIVRTIDKTRYVLCASPDYLEDHGTPQTLEDLKNHIYIPHSARLPSDLIRGLKKSLNTDLQPHLLINNSQILKDYALKGFGIIQVHEYWVQKELENGTLTEILTEFLNQDLQLYMYYQKNRFVQPKVRQFVNIVMNE